MITFHMFRVYCHEGLMSAYVWLDSSDIASNSCEHVGSFQH